MSALVCTTAVWLAVSCAVNNVSYIYICAAAHRQGHRRPLAVLLRFSHPYKAHEIGV